MNPILFLHGALGTSDQLKPLVEELDLDQTIHLLNFEGHGTETGTSRPFRIEYFAENVLQYMDDHKIEQADFLGIAWVGMWPCILQRICLKWPEG